MVGSAESGFTGTVWDAVPAEQLAQQLTTGPGTGPMAAAGLAYAGLAAALGAAAAEFRVVLSLVGQAWGSESSEDGLAQLGALARWLDDTAAAARDNADTAAQQAASYELARLSMPHLTEVTQAVRSAEEMLRATLLGPPLAGLLDTVERHLDGLRDQAAQVMRTYEAASEKLAAPWQHDAAPAVSAGAALLAEAAAPPAAAAPEPAAAVQPPALQLAQPVVPVLPDIAPPPPTVAVTPEALMPGPVLPAPAPAVPGPVPAPVAAAPAPAPAPPPIVPPAASEPVPPARAAIPRALGADAGDIGERIVVDAGFVTAPAVLGARAQRAAAPSAEGEA